MVQLAKRAVRQARKGHHRAESNQRRPRAPHVAFAHGLRLCLARTRQHLPPPSGRPGKDRWPLLLGRGFPPRTQGPAGGIMACGDALLHSSGKGVSHLLSPAQDRLPLKMEVPFPAFWRASPGRLKSSPSQMSPPPRQPLCFTHTPFSRQDSPPRLASLPLPPISSGSLQAELSDRGPQLHLTGIGSGPAGHLCPGWAAAGIYPWTFPRKLPAVGWEKGNRGRGGRGGTAEKLSYRSGKQGLSCLGQ